MLIIRAEIEPERCADVRIEGDRITAIGSFAANPDETVIEAGGAALLPGLHDHHLHFLAFASALGSLPCGPPNVHSERDLVQALTEAELPPDRDWLRGIGYHESVAGHIDRAWLDRHLPATPVRVQHRSVASGWSIAPVWSVCWHGHPACPRKARSFPEPASMDVFTIRTFASDLSGAGFDPMSERRAASWPGLVSPVSPT